MRVREIADIMKGLSDETRLLILYLLWRHPLCVCEVMGALGATQTKVSRHLIYMKNAGILEAERDDRWMVYKIREDMPEGVRRALECICALVGEAEEAGELDGRLEKILADSSYRAIHGKKSEREV